MPLTDEDKDFLEEIGKQLGPDAPSFNQDDIMEVAGLLKPVYDGLSEETGTITFSALVNLFPALAMMLEHNPKALDDFCNFRDMLFLHGLTRGWQAAVQHYDLD